MEILRNSRMPQVRKILNAVIQKVDLPFSDIMITGDNTLVIIVRETAIYTVKLHDIEPGFEISFKYTEIENLQEDEYVFNRYIFDYISSTYRFYLSMACQNNLLASEPELRGNPEFERLLSLKSIDGADFFKINGIDYNETYFVPIFSGFPVVNKVDKIGIDIFDLRDSHFLIVMNIYKKKINRNIQIYFRTINLSRRIY